MGGGARMRDGGQHPAGARDRAEARIVVLAADRVEAEVALVHGDRDSVGDVTLAALVAVADDLAARGAALNLGPDQALRRIETSTRQFGRGGPPSLDAVAQRLHRSAATMVWQVTLTDAQTGVEPFAIVTQTQAIDATVSRAALPTPIEARGRGAPAVEMATMGEVVRAEPAAATKREQIIAAAADIIARKGFSGASIREIADAAALHVPTLYQYVASKDELLELVYVRTMAALQTDLEAEVAGYATAEAKLRAGIAILVGRSDRFRHRIGLLNRELRSLSPKARARVLGQYHELLGSIAVIVRMGVMNGEFRQADPDVAANLIDAACDMWALRPFSVGRFGVEAFGTEIAELIVQGLLRVSDAPPSA